MTKVILQPAGGREATKHYVHTISNGVPIKSVQQFLDDQDALRLEQIYPDGLLRVWGLTPGHANRNARKWERMEEGDLVLFAGGSVLFALAFFMHKIHNREMAVALWGSDLEGQTWEYVYFVSRPKSQRIPYQALASVVGYSTEYVVLGLTILDSDKSAKLIEAFDLVDD